MIKIRVVIFKWATSVLLDKRDILLFVYKVNMFAIRELHDSEVKHVLEFSTLDIFTNKLRR